MKEKANQLFIDHERLVPYIYNRYLTKTDIIIKYKDDLFQEGYKALWQACLSYSEDIGKPSTYFFHCIKGKMYHYINDFILPYNNVLSTDQLYETLEEYESDDANNKLENMLTSNDSYFESNRVEMIVNVYENYWGKSSHNLAKLRASQKSVNIIRRIITLLDLGFNQTEIAKILGTTKQTINNKIKTIQEALLKEKYIIS